MIALTSPVDIRAVRARNRAERRRDSAVERREHAVENVMERLEVFSVRVVIGQTMAPGVVRRQAEEIVNAVLALTGGRHE